MSNSVNWMEGKSASSGISRPAARPAGTRQAVSPDEYSPQYTGPQFTSPQFASPQFASPQLTPQPLTPQQQSDLLGAEAVPFQQGPPPATERGFVPYYLASNIGKSVRAEFIIGSTQYIDKSGILIEVGINYFVLEDVNSRTHIMCDLYSVKFVTILQPSQG